MCILVKVVSGFIHGLVLVFGIQIDLSELILFFKWCGNQNIFFLSEIVFLHGEKFHKLFVLFWHVVFHELSIGLVGFLDWLNLIVRQSVLLRELAQKIRHWLLVCMRLQALFKFLCWYFLYLFVKVLNDFISIDSC